MLLKIDTPNILVNKCKNTFTNGVTFFQKIIICITLALCTMVAKGQFVIQVSDSIGQPVYYAEVTIIPIQNGVLKRNKGIRLYTNEEGKVNATIGGYCYVSVGVVENHKFFQDSLTLPQDAITTISLKAVDFETDPVVVTGQYMPTTADKSVLNTKVIDAKQIEAMGAVTLKDALSNQMNVRLKQDNILGSGLSMQGIGGQNIKILIDGVPMIGRLDGNIDLSQINLNNIEKIEIIEGPMSVMYGTDALGGVINLITKKSGKHSIEGNVNSYYESAGNYNTDGRLAFTFKNKTTLQASGGRNFFDGYGESGINNRVQSWKPKEQYFADGIVGFNIKNSRHRLQSQFFDELLLSRGEPVISASAVYALDDYYYTRRFNNSLFSDFVLGKNANLQLINSYSTFRRINTRLSKNLLSLEEQKTPLADDHDTSVFELAMSRGVFTHQINNRFGFQTGYDINHETGSGGRIAGNSKSIGDYAVFSTLDIRPSIRLILRPGVRVSYNTSYGSPITPSFNAKYNFSSIFSTRFSYARGFRAPALKELYLFFVDANHNIQPNENLKAELSDNFNMSFLYTPSFKKFGLRIEPSFFYNNIRNMISLAVVDPANNLYNYINIGQYRNAGANLSAEFKTKRFALQAGVSRLAVENILQQGTAAEPYSITDEVRGSISYTIPKYDLVMSAFYKYNGRVPGYGLDENNKVIQTYIQPYSMADASVAKSFLRKRVTLVLGAKNIFNVISINFNGAQNGAHSGGGNTMAIGMGTTFFTNIKIHLFSTK